MKLLGKKAGLNRDVLVIPRVDGDHVFEAESVADFSEFNELCKPPEAPAKILPGGARVTNTEDAEYKKELESYGEKKMDYIVLRSLAITPGLEWEKVKLAQPTTWHHWRAELEEFGLSWREIQRVEQMVLNVNSLSDEKLDAARKRFLAARQGQNG